MRVLYAREPGGFGRTIALFNKLLSGNERIYVPR